MKVFGCVFGADFYPVDSTGLSEETKQKATAVSKVEDEWVSVVTDEEIEKAWGNADFGDQPKREVIYDTLCKFAMGYGTGKFARAITEELGLSGGENHGRERLTEKGLKFLLTYPLPQPPSQTNKPE